MDTVFKNWCETRNEVFHAMEETEVTYDGNDKVKAIGDALVEEDLFIIGYELSRIADNLEQIERKYAEPRESEDKE